MASELNLTPSTDGQRRATVRVEFRIGLDSLAMALAYGLAHDDIVPSVERATRANVLRALHTAFNEYGETGLLTEFRPEPDLLSVVAQLFPEFDQPIQGEGEG